MLPTAPGHAGHSGCSDRTQCCWGRAAPWLQHLQLPSCPSCTGAMGLHESITPSAQTNLQLQVAVSFSSRCCGGSGLPRASHHQLPGGSGSQHHHWCLCGVSAPRGACQCPGGALSVPPTAGVQRQVVHCVERLAGLVEERFCDALTRPDDQQRTCSEEPCPAR